MTRTSSRDVYFHVHCYYYHVTNQHYACPSNSRKFEVLTCSSIIVTTIEKTLCTANELVPTGSSRQQIHTHDHDQQSYLLSHDDIRAYTRYLGNSANCMLYVIQIMPNGYDICRHGLRNMWWLCILISAWFRT